LIIIGSPTFASVNHFFQERHATDRQQRPPHALVDASYTAEPKRPFHRTCFFAGGRMSVSATRGFPEVRGCIMLPPIRLMHLIDVWNKPSFPAVEGRV
jgi:hypothetical protein